MPAIDQDNQQQPASGRVSRLTGRAPMSRSEAARHAALVRWGKKNPFAARLAAIRERRKMRRGRAKAKAARPTPEQRQAEKDQQKQQNVAAVGAALDQADNPVMSSRGIAALMGAAAGQEPPPTMAASLIKNGFAERGADGRFRLTPEGRRLLRAAEKGDEQGALDAISYASDRAARNAEKEQRAAEREQRKAERKKGGGGKKKEKRAEPEEDADLDEGAVAREAAAEAGLDEAELDDLRAAADVGGGTSEALRKAGTKLPVKTRVIARH